ncbi:hypothetical protein K4G93_22045, partial [Mycobacterium tuberculosis]|nr:hypothetical protein [Mycobacterium tuberculosis]
FLEVGVFRFRYSLPGGRAVSHLDALRPKVAPLSHSSPRSLAPSTPINLSVKFFKKTIQSILDYGLSILEIEGKAIAFPLFYAFF